MKAGSLRDNNHTEHLPLLYLSSALRVAEWCAIVRPSPDGFILKRLVIIWAYLGTAPHVHPLLLSRHSLHCAPPVSLHVRFRLDSSCLAAPHCVRTLRCSNPPIPAHLLWTEPHSSHAPPTRFLSLLLLTHESLSFFPLTNVGASQKRLHLLSSITHRFSSTTYQYVPVLGHNPSASRIFPPHSSCSHLPPTFTPQPYEHLF